MNWYFMKDGERKGPVNLEGLRDLLQEGEIDKETMVWNKGMGDEWSKVADVTVLSGPQENVDDPEVKEDFKRKMEERKAAMAAQQKAAMQRYIIIGASFALLIVLIVAVVKGAPKREWGVSSSNPVCSLKKLEKKLIDEYGMEKKTLESFEHFGEPASKIYQYSDAKKTPGDHVSGRGVITVTVDDDYKVRGVFGSFPSPGLRGPLLNNPSVGSVSMQSLWLAHGGEEKKVLLMRNEILPRVGDTGLTKVPDDAVCEVVETEKMRGIWTEHGLNTRYSMVYFETL